MSDFEQLRKEIEQQFIDKADDWKKFLSEINKAIKKFKPTIDDKELYNYDTLCQDVLDAALAITKNATAQGQTMPPELILKEIYKRLVVNKVKDVEIKVVPKTSNNN